MNLSIDKEFKSIIPSLNKEEYDLLEKSIIKEGCRDAIIIWNNIIIDGHNRYEICTKHNIDFKVLEKDFKERLDVLIWIKENQLGRRNLTDSQKTYLIGSLYKDIKKRQGGQEGKSNNKFGINQFKKEVEVAIMATSTSKEKTLEKIAKEYNIGENTVKRAEQFVNNINTISENVGNGFKEKILKEQIDATQVEITQLAKLEPEKQKKVIEKIEQKEEKTIKNALREVEKEEKKQELTERAKDFIENNSIQIIHKDFRDVDLKDNSIDLILTDPPYPKEYLPLWKDLFLLAKKVLKPSGFLITYSGQLHLDEIFSFSKDSEIKYYWAIALFHNDKTQLIHPRNVICEWKPILIFYKEPLLKVSNTIVDVIRHDTMDKSLHDWQQGTEGFKFLIEHFSKPNDLVLDPFAGSGTVLQCCKELKRKCIGIEIDINYIDIIKGRLSSE